MGKSVVVEPYGLVYLTPSIFENMKDDLTDKESQMFKLHLEWAGSFLRL